MLWRLSGPVRSFAAPVPAHRRCHSSSAAARIPPLKILFCGSDDFSIASLRALSRAQKDEPQLIQSIDVVHRPAKRTGRGLKHLREVPIKAAAAEDSFVTHTIDTFTGWTPPSRVDLIVAVSFGLFVPPRILNLAQYGGLNVHPSLLPDLKGPAPIQQAILKGRRHTGVSVQTLHPSQFDGGVILAQTPAPGILLSDEVDAEALTKRLGDEGAKMLVDVLKAGTFVPPLKDVGWYAGSGGPIDHAGKIVKGDQEIDFATTTLERVFAIRRAIGDPWVTLSSGERLVLNEFSRAQESYPESTERLWVPERTPTGSKGDVLLARLACGGTIKIDKSTISGRPVGGGNQRMANMLRSGETHGVAAKL